jgi:hypothetical protein
MFRKPLATTSGANTAVSGGGNNPWASFFGQPTIPIKINPYDEKNEATWILPQAYSSCENFELANTMELLTFTEDSWYTQYALPIKKVNTISASWNKWEFSPKLASIVPERGVGRLVDSTKTSGSASFVRRGIGMRLEHGFMNTEVGRRSYVMNLRQINNSVIETNNFGVIYAYLSVDQYNLEWEKHNGYHKGKRVSEILDTDRRHWDILKQDKKGLEILDSYIKDRMFRYRGKADTYIVPPKIMQYVTIVPDSRTDYYITGPDGPKMLQDGVNQFRTFGENRVYETRFYDVDEDGPIDMMKNPAQIGEMHLAFDHNAGGDYTNYKSKWRSIQIYDEDNDKMATLDLRFLLKNAKRHDPNTGDLYHMDDPDVQLYNTNYDKKETIQDFLHYIDEHGNLQKCDYMGQSYLPIESIFELAETAINGMKKLNDCADNSLHIKWRDGINAIKTIENIEYNTEVEGWFADLIGVNTKFKEHPGGKGFSPVFGLEEFEPNDNGSLNLPESGPLTFPLPPGFANYPGFKTIADAANQGEDYVKKLGFNFKWFEIVRDFVNIIDNLVSYLRLYFPGSIVINENYSSSWWHLPSAETTFFENIVTKHRYPLWLKGGDGDVLGASKIGDTINDKEAASTEIKEDFGKIFAPYKKLYAKQKKKLTDNDDKDYMQNLELDGDEVGKIVKETIANTFVLATLSGFRYGADADGKDTDQTKFKNLKNLIGTLAIEDDKHTKLLVTSDEFIGTIADYISNNSSDFKVSAIKIKRILQGILEEIETLKKISVRGGDKYSVILRNEGNDEGKHKFEKNSDGNFSRAPLTGSPKLFKSIAKFSEKNDLSVMPSSPNNPNRPANLTELAETSDLLTKGEYYDPKKVHPSLRPLHINEDFNAQNIGAVINVIDNNNKELYQEDLKNIGASFSDYDNERFEASSFGIGKTKARNLNKKASYQYGSREKGLLRSSDDYVSKYDDYYLRKKYNRDGNTSILRDDIFEDTSMYQSKITREFGAGVYDGLDEIDDNLHRKFDTPTFKDLFFKVDKNADDDLIRVVSQVFLAAPTNQKNFEALIRYDIIFPWNFLVLRPHQRYETLTLIKTKSGPETGVTFMGPSKFTLGDDASTQEHLGFYTYYSQSVIHEPKNVFVIKNSFVDGYNGGSGAKPYINQPETYDPQHDIYGDGSIFVVALPRYETELLNPLSITGKFHYMDEEVYDMKENDNLHYSTAPFYNRMYGWQGKGVGSDGGFDFIYMNERATPNATVWFGHTLYYIGKDGAFTGVRQGTGHWGPDHTYIGCNDARAGKMKEFRSVDYNHLAQI